MYLLQLQDNYEHEQVARVWSCWTKALKEKDIVYG